MVKFTLLDHSKVGSSVLVKGRKGAINIVLEEFQVTSYQKLIIFHVEYNICLQSLDIIQILINKTTNPRSRLSSKGLVKHLRGVKISEDNWVLEIKRISTLLKS